MATTTDPVCGMALDTSKAVGSTYSDVVRLLEDPQIPGASVTHRGATYYFCSEACKERFEADPEKFAPTTR